MLLCWDGKCKQQKGREQDHFFKYKLPEIDRELNAFTQPIILEYKGLPCTVDPLKPRAEGAIF